jgi:hypothetical protein
MAAQEGNSVNGELRQHAVRGKKLSPVVKVVLKKTPKFVFKKHRHQTFCSPLQGEGLGVRLSRAGERAGELSFFLLRGKAAVLTECYLLITYNTFAATAPKALARENY